MAHSAAPTVFARHDLTTRGVVVLAVATMAAITGLDLLDGRLGAVFAVGFVLVVTFIPLAVDVRSLLPAGVLPPVLLLVALVAVAIVAPGAIEVDGDPDAGRFARVIAGVLDLGVVLLVTHAVVVAIIVWRIGTDPRSERTISA